MTNWTRLLISLILTLPVAWLVNYLADVLPQTRRLTIPLCKACAEPRTLQDFLKMRPCRACQAPVALRTSLVVVGVLLLFIAAAFLPLSGAGYFPALIILSYFMIVFVIDMEHRLILTETSIVGLILGALVGWKLHGLVSTIAGGIAGFLIMFALYGLGILFARWMSKRRGEEIEEVALGFGDVTLSAILGLMVGVQQIVMLLLLAIFLGGIFSLLLLIVLRLLNRYQQFTAIPYAPFLLAAATYLLFRP